jgi:predicted ATP-dependent serine protease
MWKMIIMMMSIVNIQTINIEEINCGAKYIKLIGQRLTCKEWNTIQEMTISRGHGSSGSGSSITSPLTYASIISPKK